MTHPVPTLPTQEPLPFAYARGAWALLATLMSFQVVAFGESLASFVVGTTMSAGSVWKLGVANVAVEVAGLTVRAVLLVRVLRLPSAAKLGPLPIWQPVVLTVVAIVSALGSLGMRTLTSVFVARHESTQELANLATVSSVVGGGAYVADQVLMIAAMWLAFVRGRDVLPPVGPE